MWLFIELIFNIYFVGLFFLEVDKLVEVEKLLGIYGKLNFLIRNNIIIISMNNLLFISNFFWNDVLVVFFNFGYFLKGC